MIKNSLTKHLDYLTFMSGNFTSGEILMILIPIKYILNIIP
jgi:hypothetical protein